MHMYQQQQQYLTPLFQQAQHTQPMPMHQQPQRPVFTQQPTSFATQPQGINTTATGQQPPNPFTTIPDQNHSSTRKLPKPRQQSRPAPPAPPRVVLCNGAKAFNQRAIRGLPALRDDDHITQGMAAAYAGAQKLAGAVVLAAGLEVGSGNTKLKAQKLMGQKPST